MVALLEREDDARHEAFHEFLIEAGVLGAIGNVAANIVLGELPAFQSKLVERSIAFEVERRVRELFDRLGFDGVELKAVVPAGMTPANVPDERPTEDALPSEVEWARRIEFDGTSHAFIGSQRETTLCGLTTIESAGWSTVDGNAVPKPCTSCVNACTKVVGR